MYITLIGDINTDICVEHLPRPNDVLFVKDKFYRVGSRYYNTETEEWILAVGSFTPRPEVLNKWTPLKGG